MLPGNMNNALRLRLTWAVAAIGCLLGLCGDLSGSPGAKMGGDLVSLVGFIGVLYFYLVPKIGNFRSYHHPRETK